MGQRDKNKIRCVPVPLTEVQFRGIFERCDLNGDGCLNKNELKKAFQEMSSRMPEWRARSALWHADLDGDGCINGVAEWDQLVKYALHCGYTIH